MLYFDFRTGKQSNSYGDIFRADEWLHMDINGGMMSMFFSEKEILRFILFLSEVIINDNGIEKKTKNYLYSSDSHDKDGEDKFVNIHITNNKIVIVLNFNLRNIPSFIDFLYQSRSIGEDSSRDALGV